MIKKKRVRRKKSSSFGKKREPFRKRTCRLCSNKVVYVDYKNIPMLRSFTTERGKILSSKITGNCTMHQRQLSTAIKRARNLALIPYINV